MSQRQRTGERLVRLAEQQGYRVRQTRSGWTVYGKDGRTTVGLHRTPSDHRAMRNVMADLKKMGVQV